MSHPIQVATGTTDLYQEDIQAVGKPSLTVSPDGIANGKSTVTNNGADYGPDTPGTNTQGLAEAVAAG